MAAEPLFIDAGGFYALVSPQSESHELAVGIMQETARARRRAVTTDYISAKPNNSDCTQGNKENEE